jgi:hypothetical protein
VRQIIFPIRLSQRTSKRLTKIGILSQNKIILEALKMCDFVFFHATTVRPNACGYYGVFTPSSIYTTRKPAGFFLPAGLESKLGRHLVTGGRPFSGLLVFVRA